MEIKQEHIVVEVFKSEFPDDKGKQRKAIRKVYETTDGKYFIERPEAYFMMEEVDENTFWNMQVNYNTLLEKMLQYAYDYPEDDGND